MEHSLSPHGDIRDGIVIRLEHGRILKHLVTEGVEPSKANLQSSGRHKLLQSRNRATRELELNK